MKHFEWDIVVLMVAFFAAVVLLGSGLRCEARAESRLADAGAAGPRKCWRPTGEWEVWALEGEDWHRVASAPDLDTCIRFGGKLGVGRWGCELESE